MLASSNAEVWANCPGCFGSIVLDLATGEPKIEKWWFNGTEVTHYRGSVTGPACQLFGESLLEILDLLNIYHFSSLCAPKNAYVAPNQTVQDDRGTWGLFFDARNYAGTEPVEIVVYVSDHVWAPFWLTFQITVGLLVLLTFYKEFWRRVSPAAAAQKIKV